jgi:PTH2 family peptidyl-tRNA hydrolase
VSKHYRVKQVILVPRDLKNAKGKPVHAPKMMAQVGHAAMAWLGTRFKGSPRDSNGRFIVELSDAERTWLVDGDFAKIVLGVDDQAAMHDILTQATYIGLRTEVIEDAGHTEFDGQPTITCAAIGPDTADLIDKVTGHLVTL